MLKKEEVFVRVSSEKKARKLAKLLEMFGERVYSLKFKYCAMGHLYKDEWHSGDTPPSDKTEVSLKQLRNILAVEHLREGDVVITEHLGETIIAVYNKSCKREVCLFEAKKWVRVSDGFLWDDKGCFDKFIRYATEEEKALLEPKKELEVGKWYKHQHGGISFFEDRLSGYGIDCIGFYYVGSHTSDINSNFWTEATTQEVEEALIKEAKRRGFVKGAVFEGVEGSEKDSKIPINEIHYDSEMGWGLFSGNSWLFFQGKWAEVVKPEKSLEERVKELEQKVKQL